MTDANTLKDKLDSLPDSEWYSLSLDCDHLVYVRVGERLALSDPLDRLIVMCPACRNLKNRGRDIPTAWQNVIDVEVTNNEFVSTVQNANAFLMQGHIMRLPAQPTSGNPIGRIIPFPYRKKPN